MAKQKKKNENPGTDNDAVIGSNPAKERGFDDDFFADASIDLTSDAKDSSDSDSELDINALLRKYMPEYQDEAPSEEAEKTPEEAEKSDDAAPADEPAEPEAVPGQEEPKSDALDDILGGIGAADAPEAESGDEFVFTMNETPTEPHAEAEPEIPEAPAEPEPETPAEGSAEAAPAAGGVLARLRDAGDETSDAVNALLDELADGEETVPAEEPIAEEPIPEEPKPRRGGLFARIRQTAENDAAAMADELSSEPKPKRGSLFSRMQKTVEEEEAREEAEQEELISALDTAFVVPADGDFSVPAAQEKRDDGFLDEYELTDDGDAETPAEEKPDAPADDPVDFGAEPAYPADEVKKPVGEEIPDERVEELFGEVKPQKKFFGFFRRKDKKKKPAADEDFFLTDEQEEQTPAAEPAEEHDDETDALIAEAAAAMFGRSKRAEQRAKDAAADDAAYTGLAGKAAMAAAALADDAETSAEAAAEPVETAAAVTAEAAEAAAETVEKAAEETAEAVVEAAAGEPAPEKEERPGFVKQSRRSAKNLSDEELLRWAAETLAEDDFRRSEEAAKAAQAEKAKKAAEAPVVTADSSLTDLQNLADKQAEDDNGSTKTFDSIKPGDSDEKKVGWQTPDEPFEDEDIDPTDINLMVAFGLDDEKEKGKKAGRAKEFGDKIEQKQQARDAAQRLERPEFIDKSQIPEIRKEYGRRSVSLFIRLILCFALTAVLFLFENIEAVTRLVTGTGMQFGGVLDPSVYPAVYSMVSLQIMLLACLCAYDEIAAGVKGIFRGTPRPESMTALLALAGILYSAVVARITISPEEPKMFNFLVALAALMTIIYSVFNNKREMMNFRIVSSKKPKHIVRRLRDDESENETKAFEETEDVCDVMKIEKTDFIGGFFARLAKPDTTTGTFMMFVMGAAVLLSLIFGLIARIRGGNGTAVARAMYESLLMLAPLSVFVTFSYPFYRANVTAKEYDSAIIGETSLEEYSNASVISFDDKNVFPSYFVKVQNIRIYNNARIDRVLYYASSVFAYAGGPLQDVFEVATKDLGNSTNVRIYDTEDNFLATQVDGVNIIFGSCDALRDRGFEIPDDAIEDDVDLSEELSIMYMFRENKLVAKMYVKYEMDSDMDTILKQFSGNGLYACVRTFDPNIDEAMIAKKLSMKKMPLKIVRYADPEEVVSYEAKADSGLVTCGSQKSLLQVISFCGKVLRTRKTHVALAVMSILVSAAIMTILLLANLLPGLTPLTITLYQLVWLIPALITSRVFIR
ncbi:MAG: hypothetical protein II557_12610 [Clostridia bacterium]|nr:hypothetical protein [Clostridia bacterium]